MKTLAPGARPHRVAFSQTGVPWNGTVLGRPVTCTTVQTPPGIAPGGGDAAVVTTLGLWCTGTRRHALRALVSIADEQGTLRLDGLLCRRGPRPAHPHAKFRACCPLAGGPFTGAFTFEYPGAAGHRRHERPFSRKVTEKDLSDYPRSEGDVSRSEGTASECTADVGRLMSRT